MLFQSRVFNSDFETAFFVKCFKRLCVNIVMARAREFVKVVVKHVYNCFLLNYNYVKLQDKKLV